MADTKGTDILVATVGVDYLGTDGKAHRLEVGDEVGADKVHAHARKWMGDAGFLVRKSDLPGKPEVTA